ncbi:MAG TPA: ankyrin repeat domain-containing protein [Gammaproteobacteria bacterium]|nr:ankyrin repeat domain-containing protein [Gammaproteobacteria bacterium]
MGASQHLVSGHRLIRTAAPLAMLAALALFAAAGQAAGEDALASLIQSGKRDAALELIRSGADVNAAQGDGTTPLHWAVYKLDRGLAAELLKRGAKPNAVNSYGASPLAEAVKAADLELVEMLLDAGASVESPNEDGQTALMLAARGGALDVAKLLVARGANVNARESWRGQTALMWAADANHPEIAKLLIEHGADVATPAMAIDWPAQITSEPRAQYRPTGGLTPLLYAARSGCTGCVAAMLDAGANKDQPNPDGVTPLIIAIDNLRFDTAKLLIERGANPHHWDWWGRTPLYVAVDMSSYRSRFGRPSPAAKASAGGGGARGTTAIDVIRLLLDKGVDPNPQLDMHRPGRGGNSGRFIDDLLTTGVTPLIRAAIGHDVEAVRALLQHGALVDLPNVMGVTPLMAAAGIGVSQRDRRLDLGDDPEASAIATIELLLAAGADVNARIVDQYSRTARIARLSTMTEREGQTALYGTIRFGWPRVAQYLIDHGAKADVVDALGKSPLDAAEGKIGGRDNKPNAEIAAMLRKAGAG